MAKGKLGRNPLEKKTSTPRTLPSIQEKVDLDRRHALFQKYQQLGLEIHWEEFLKAVVGSKLERFTRFLRF